MGRINENGVMRDMTEDERAKVQEFFEGMKATQGIEERLEELTRFMEGVKEALKKLGVKLE